MNQKSGPEAHEATTSSAAKASEPTFVEPGAGAAPIRKRSSFLPSRFFDGGDKEAAARADDKGPGAGEPAVDGSKVEGEVMQESAADSSTDDPAFNATGPAPLFSRLALGTKPVPASPPPAPSIHQQSAMTSHDTTTTSLPSNSRASAQLTIGFEISSLQLTPFFKLSSARLKALSDIVSLHLIAAEAADSPLAAGISFRIEHVDLDDASRIKSIVLKPLSESPVITATLPKLQVDNVAIMGGAEDALISIRTSRETSMVVQVFGKFAIVAMEFTPAFEIGSLRLEPTTSRVVVQVTPSTGSREPDSSLSFELGEVELGTDGQIVGASVTPGMARNP